MTQSNGPEGLVGYVDRLVAELAEQSAAAIEQGEISAVHRARVATRRFGAALQVVRPMLDEDELAGIARALKKIRRSVQDMRDLDVMQEHLRETYHGEHDVAVARLTAHMAQQRESIQQKVASKAKLEKWLEQVQNWQAIRGGLQPKREQARDAILRSLHEQFGGFAIQADRMAEAYAQPAGADYCVEPHAFRIAGKSLRYTFEMADAESLGVEAVTLKTYKKLQDALGLWHDYLVLSRHIAERCTEEISSPSYQQNADDLMLLGAAVIRDSRRELQRFAELWGKHRESLLVQLAAIGQTRGNSSAEGTQEPSPA